MLKMLVIWHIDINGIQEKRIVPGDYLLHVFYFRPQGGAGDRTLSIGHGSNGIIELLQKSMQEFNFDKDWDFELNIEKRGVSELPNYFFRDDGMDLWKAIKTYAKEVIDIFYLQDDDVINDMELKTWMEEIIRYGKLWDTLHENTRKVIFS